MPWVLGWAALVGLIGIAILLFAPQNLLGDLFDAIDGDASEAARRSLSDARTSADGPPVVWIRFDDASLEQLALPGQRHAVPRDAIARLLERIRGGAASRPALVFLDVAIGEREISEVPALGTALSRWRRDRLAPPLAVFAGRSCSPPPQEAERLAPGSQAVAYFRPLYGQHVATLGAPVATPTSANPVWACPGFVGLHQAEFSCVTALSDAEMSDTFALPSPAWFAESVKRERSAAGPLLAGRLAEATHRCRGGDARGTGARPYLSRVHFTYRPGPDREDLPQLLPSGRPLLSIVRASDMLRDNGDLGALSGAIVVIGGGSSWAPDLIGTETGSIPGSVLVGFALREGWIFGAEAPAGRKTSILAYVAGFGLIRVVTMFLPGWRRRAMKSRPRLALLVFVLLQEQMVVLLLVALFLLMPGLFGVDIALGLVSAIVAAELVLLLDLLRKDWEVEKPVP